MKCKECGNEFKPVNKQHVYCGSKSKKIGCSYKRSLYNRSKWNNSDKGKEYYKEYGKKWKREQRKNKTEYSKRQKKVNKKWIEKNKERVRLNLKKWRTDNIEKIKHKNKQRLLLKRGLGEISEEYIDILKKEQGFKCNCCGIEEYKLLNKYGSQFSKLTIDHIIPLNKGGFNIMSNIQLLCVGCNSKKKDNIELNLDKNIVGITFGSYDIIHDGHTNLLKNCKEFCDVLIVAISSDEFHKEKKGEYPILKQYERAEIISSIKEVDYVIIENSWEDKEKYIKEYGVDIFCQGDDWEGKFDDLPCTVIYLPRTEMISSSGIKEKILSKDN